MHTAYLMYTFFLTNTLCKLQHSEQKAEKIKD